MAINQPGFGNNRPMIKSSSLSSKTATNVKTNVDTDEPQISALERMQTLLDYVGYQTLYVPKDEANVAGRLLVTLEPMEEEISDDFDDEDKRELLENSPLLQIMFLDEIIEEDNSDNFTPSTLQFYLALPFQIGEDKLWESYRLLAILSQLVPVGYFNMDNNGVIFFNYSFLTQQKEIDNVLLVEIIQIISFFIKKFIGKISDFASGTKTLDQVIVETEKELLNV